MGEIFYFHRAGDIILTLNLLLQRTEPDNCAISCFKRLLLGLKDVKHGLVISRLDQQCFINLERFIISILENTNYFLVSTHIERNLVVL